MTRSTIFKNNRIELRSIVEAVSLIVVYFISFLLSPEWQLVSGAIMLVAGITFYFYYSHLGTLSYLKFNALFSGVWLVTIGLSQMRFLEYQTIWAKTTWVAVCLAHLAFLFANKSAHGLFPAIDKRWGNKFNAIKLGKRVQLIKVSRSPNFYFGVATICMIIGVLSFFGNVASKGYIPLFVINKNPRAYVEFYMRLQIFYVASTVSAGIAYFVAVKLPLPNFKKALLFLYILILVFVIPILTVQRGTFINAALVLLAAVYLLSNRQFWVLIVSLSLILGIYLLGSSIRGYSEAQLDVLFPTNTIGNSKPDPDQPPGSEPTDEEITKEVTSFVLPGKAAFIVSYFTIGHDNFNYAVTHKTGNTWGLRQLEPFNVILRSKTLANALDQVEIYLVRPYLNTSNLISMAYYDFGVTGVVALMLIWSFAFGIIEAFYNRYKSLFSMLAYGVCLIPITLSFFEAWMSYFTTWLMFGTVFLLFVFSTFKVQKVSADTIAASLVRHGHGPIVEAETERE